MVFTTKNKQVAAPI